MRKGNYPLTLPSPLKRGEGKSVPTGEFGQSVEVGLVHPPRRRLFKVHCHREAQISCTQLQTTQPRTPCRKGRGQGGGDAVSPFRSMPVHTLQSQIPNRPRGGRRPLASLQDAQNQTATGGLRFATPPGYSLPTLPGWKK